MSQLRELLIERIAADGPIGIDAYMSACLGHPEYGYYMRRDPFGVTGDFTTAPEISQMFGELIGLWCVDLWQRMGRPAPFALAELGPGRGTLMADALRALAGLPECRAAAQIHLVETSPHLRAIQRRTLDGAEIAWHDSPAELPELPTLLIANEFFDALPIRQFVYGGAQWHERRVGISAGEESPALVFTDDPRPAAAADLPPAARQPAAPGDIAESAPLATHYMAMIAAHLGRTGGAALIVDYGYTRPAAGDSLQALQRHDYADILAAPGQADLTAHVDFAALAAAAAAAGAQIWGPVTQRTFLTLLGIEARAAVLRNNASAAQRQDIDSALARMISPAQMGDLFKVLAIGAPAMAHPAGFTAGPGAAAEEAP